MLDQESGDRMTVNHEKDLGQKVHETYSFNKKNKGKNLLEKITTQITLRK